MELLVIIVGVGLLLGAFYTSWLLWKIVEDVEKKKDKKKEQM